MPNLVHTLLRILAGIAGASFLYVAFFLYEDEEARIQNRLEQIWQKINALQSTAMSREVAFLQGATRTTSAILDAVFGNKLLSLRSVAVSLAFSYGSMFIWSVLAPDVYPVRKVLFISLGFFLFFLGSLPALATSGKYAPQLSRLVGDSEHYSIGLITSVVCLSLLEPLFSLFPKDPIGPDLSHMAIGFFITIVMIFLGVLSDVVFVIFFRRIIKNIESMRSIFRILFNLSALGIIVALLVGPGIAVYSGNEMFGRTILERLDHLLGPGLAVVLSLMLVVLALLGVPNLLDVLCLLLLLSVMIALLGHRLLWPLIKRPLYAANRKQLIKNSKLLGALGTMLLLYAFPNNAVVKWITHFLPNFRGG